MDGGLGNSGGSHHPPFEQPALGALRLRGDGCSSSRQARSSAEAEPTAPAQPAAEREFIQDLDSPELAAAGEGIGIRLVDVHDANPATPGMTAP